MHSLIYGFNLYNEFKNLRQQYKENKYEVFYFSKALTNCELFVEFFFEILNERSEPLIALIELVKAYLKFKEYYTLVHKENINAYIAPESYKELKRLKEIKDSQFTLARTKKALPKIKGFKVSSKLQEMRKR
jgi:hypothetical protein